MPELPEVETIRRDLEKVILGKKIKSVILFDSKTARNKAAFFINFLTNRQVVSISRRGKLLIFEINKKKEENESMYLLVHLKMTGQLIFSSNKEYLLGGHSSGDEALKRSDEDRMLVRHTRSVIKFSGGGTLFFNDMRRFGYLQLVTKSDLEKIKKNNYGPEPLTEELTIDYLVNILKNRSTNIKALLLNQKLIAGLGNIYVDEALFLAKIKPSRSGKSIKRKELDKLLIAINEIIASAIKNRGTTFNNYVDSSGRKGNFLSLLKVYSRGGEPCYKCKKPIKKIKLAGRGTHYCPNCQK